MTSSFIGFSLFLFSFDPASGIPVVQAMSIHRMNGMIVYAAGQPGNPRVPVPVEKPANQGQSPWSASKSRPYPGLFGVPAGRLLIAGTCDV
jgi:hypothetical protein